MKKFVVALCALAMLGVVSCKKEKEDSSDQSPIPVYTEGCYQPVAQIATITEDGALAEEWVWSGKNLDHIALAAGGQVLFNYSGNYISKVTNTGAMAEEIRYYYTDNAITKCEIYYNNALAISMDLLHNAAGKISSATMTIDDNFLLNMFGSMFGQGFALEKVLGEKNLRNMSMLAKLERNAAGKFEVGDKNFSMTLVWDGDDVRQQIVNGTVIFNISSDDLDQLLSILPIPDEAQQYVQLIQLAMAMGGGKLPLTMTVNDTINVTHDANYNPKFCFWGEMFSPENLSLHNVLTETNSGATKLGMSLMGQNADLFSYPFEGYTEYIYQYNDKKYPTQVSGDKNIIYTYKQ